MFEHYTFGTQVNPSGPSDAQISPRDTSEPMQCASPSPSISLPSPSHDLEAESASPRTTMESLVHKLSEQNIKLDDLGVVSPLQLLSSPPLSDNVPTAVPCSELQVDEQYSLTRSEPCERPSPSSSSSSLPSLIEDVPYQPPSDPKRLRRQLNTAFHNNPTNARTIHTLVEEMISSGDQCNINMPPPPTWTYHPTPAYIEPDDPENLECVNLEVDEAFCTGSEEESWMENMIISLRGASTPRGIRKFTTLRYRSSADVALHCPNVVRSRPRMRRRRQKQTSSGASSVAPATPSSPPPASPALLPH